MLISWTYLTNPAICLPLYFFLFPSFSSWVFWLLCNGPRCLSLLGASATQACCTVSQKGVLSTTGDRQRPLKSLLRRAPTPTDGREWFANTAESFLWKTGCSHTDFLKNKMGVMGWGPSFSVRLLVWSPPMDKGILSLVTMSLEGPWQFPALGRWADCSDPPVSPTPKALWSNEN